MQELVNLKCRRCILCLRIATLHAEVLLAVLLICCAICTREDATRLLAGPLLVNVHKVWFMHIIVTPALHWYHKPNKQTTKLSKLKCVQQPDMWDILLCRSALPGLYPASQLSVQNSLSAR